MMNAPQISGVLKEEFLAEINAIADWWIAHCQDEQHGGFIGEIDVDNNIDPQANKGCILNCRILWFFSEAALFTGSANYAAMANRAYHYLTGRFVDRDHGGMLWELNHKGEVVNGRKQVYAQAFAIYGLSAYFKLTKNDGALKLAREIYQLLETRAYDNNSSGYFEAFGRDWSPIQDVRLSKLDLDSPKSMNTHLHILEAYTALQAAAPARDVAASIKRCLDCFDRYIINKETFHLRMFLSVDWRDESSSISYGHDIESSWLLWEAVNILQDNGLREYYRDIVIKLARNCVEQGVGEYHEVRDAYNFKTGTLMKERIWWVQAEGMIGFLNAYQITGEKKFYQAFVNLWEFIKTYQKDHDHGEWRWLSTLDHPSRGDYKIGFWKAPYHNGRAMMEVCRRLDELSDSKHF